MSAEYDDYLAQHQANITAGFNWIANNLPQYITKHEDMKYQILCHDDSKRKPDEYIAYDNHFYGSKSNNSEDNFNVAWLKHIHRNPHHWQHWILINDDPKLGEIILPMPLEYIVEMVCDWWTFSWKQNNLTEIFKWYEEHRKYIKLHPDTRKTVELILNDMRNILSEDNIQ